MSSSTFPEINSPVRERGHLSISLDGIDDLFYDGLTEPEEELIQLQSVFDNNRNKQYFRALFNRGTNNRAKFKAFARETIGIDGAAANQVFSCAANSFQKDYKGSPVDVIMTQTQFAAGIIRLANLWALMNDGMINTSRLADQTAEFLDHVNESL